MRQRRWLRFLSLIFALVLVGAACGDDNKSSTGSEGGASSGGAKPGAGKKIGLVYDVGGKGDKSFNDAAYAGLTKAADELGVDVKDLEPSAGGENREELLRLLANDGYELIIGVGFAFADNMKAVSADFPNISFAIVDDESFTAPNVTSLVFAEEQGSYLVGQAAALQTKSNHVGFVGGVETDLIKKFEAGYVAGVKSLKPDATIDIKYLTQVPDFSGFRDPAKGKVAAESMYGAGADVVYHAAGGSGTGVFEAAKDASGGTTGANQKWAIGVDSDQYQTAGPDFQNFILTSMLKRVDTAVFDAIKSFIDGSLKAGSSRYNLANDGIGYATSGGFVDAYKSDLDKTAKDIADGKITVPTKP